MSELARTPQRAGPLPGSASAWLARWGAPPAWLITAAFGLVYVLVAPVSTDLAAAGYRSELFAGHGLTLWDNGWYGGHHLLAYSLLAPGLGALLGPQLLVALSMTFATGLFAKLIDGAFAPRATRIASLWFAYGAAIGMLANRVPFDLGLATGIGALLAARTSTERSGMPRLRASSVALALLSALASPIAGAFLALAAVAWAVSGHFPGGGRAIAGRTFGLTLAAIALLPIVVLVLAFPEGGPQPFAGSAFYPTLAIVLVLAALTPSRDHVLRTGMLLYASALTAAYLIPTAVGGNADRLGALLAGPVAACVLLDARHRWRTWALALLAPVLVYWQSNASVGDYISAASDAGATASYYTPLLAELRRLGVGYGSRAARIEVVPTRDHAEARWVAPHVMIARGWERQLDVDRNSLFYRSPLRPDRFADWLAYAAISYVALPDAPLDYSARAEAKLVRGEPSYLREVWRSRHWRLFEVLGATPLAQPPSVITHLDRDSFTLRTPAAGTFRVRVRFTPYWALAGGHGCVSRAPGGWTDVRTRAAASAHVVIDFSLARVFEHGPRCR